VAALEGPQVRLRPPDPKDQARLFAWFSDPEIVAPFDRFVPEPYEEFVRSMRTDPDDATSLNPRFVIERRTDGLAVGVVGHFRPHPVLETVEVWYIVGERSARGQGLGREAVRLLTDHLFATTSVERVAATCDVENVPSARLAEGLGFRQEATLRSAFYHHGRWHDVYVYGVTRAEWSHRSAPR
jgi:RimJ/RimL family protein N-acetyltransferase